ncbi:MAG: DUF4416 family protein [Pirellulaceae bacterium]|nr:DUF4416 family protein [Planctomycetales bacterium]
MGAIKPPSKVLLLIAASSRYPQALQWSVQRARETWGEIGRLSEAFVFEDTDYYASTMGSGLLKQFIVLAERVDPGRLASIKCLTNQWEEEYSQLSAHAEPRPLNLDPGYLTEAKLILASTKDHSHRIYLSDGIYAEITLDYYHRAWRAQRWTYPDYLREDYQRFFTNCRDYLRQLRGQS